MTAAAASATPLPFVGGSATCPPSSPPTWREGRRKRRKERRERGWRECTRVPHTLRRHRCWEASRPPARYDGNRKRSRTRRRTRRMTKRDIEGVEGVEGVEEKEEEGYWTGFPHTARSTPLPSLSSLSFLRPLSGASACPTLPTILPKTWRRSQTP